ncbi:MAG: hypothetical protein IPM69_14950 [Ignavibacteria bacterium]|nr:hypothetical protein [Ignavibacteria bacterium]
MGNKLPKTPEAARNREKALRDQADKMGKRATMLAAKKKEKAKNCVSPKTLKAAETRLSKAQKNMDKVKSKKCGRSFSAS